MLVFFFSDRGLFILLRGIEISHLQTPILENPTCEKMRCPSYNTVWLFHFHFFIFMSARVFVSLRVKPFKNNPVLTPLPRNPATQHADFATGRGSVTLPATQ